MTCVCFGVGVAVVVIITTHTYRQFGHTETFSDMCLKNVERKPKNVKLPNMKILRNGFYWLEMVGGDIGRFDWCGEK